MKRLEGKTAIVTGAGRGLGQAMALAFAREGANVGVLEIDPASARTTADAIVSAGGAADVQTADLADRTAALGAIDAVASRFGGVDILVNNAMWISYDLLDGISEATVDRMLGIGFKAPIWCMQGASRHMANGGAIINISSPAAEIGLANALVYSAIKGAVLSMTRSAATGLGPRKIRVVAIAPGPIHTRGSETIVDQKGFEQRLRRTPMGRLGTPEDIARAAVFLASDDAEFISGDMLHVDGAMTFSFT